MHLSKVVLDPLKLQIDHHIADLSPMGSKDPSEARCVIYDPRFGNDLSDSRKFENLYMVAAGIRSSSMFHPETIDEIIQVHELARRTGLGMVVRKCGIQVYKAFIFNEEKEELALKIPDLYESMGFRQFIVAQITIANLTAGFLDYPNCCREDFMAHLMRGTDQDLYAREKLLQERNPDPRAYFLERFVPCSPVCPEAVRIGMRIEKKLEKIDPELKERYLKLRLAHMKDVKDGVIVDEKRRRDEMVACRSGNG